MYKWSFFILIIIISSCTRNSYENHDRPVMDVDTLYIKYLFYLEDCEKGRFYAKRDFINNQFYYPRIGLIEFEDGLDNYAKLKYNVTFIYPGCMARSGVGCYQDEMMKLLFIKYGQEAGIMIREEYKGLKKESNN